MSRPHIETPRFSSQCLKQSLFNDPITRDVPVYLPPGYDAQDKIRYPTFYILAGWSGNGTSYLQACNVFTKSLPHILDEAIASKQMDPCIVIFPNCESRLGHSQYINSAACGPYMDYLCDEVVPFIDGHYKTIAQAQARGILGHSSGGFGALVTGMLRPDVFLNICSSAGDSFFEYLYLNMIPQVQGVLEQFKGVQAFLKHYFSNPNPMGLLPRDQGETLMLLNMCACFVPNLKQPDIFADLFFDLNTGQLIDEVWQRILAWDPVHMIDQHTSAIAQWQQVLLEAGTHDEYALHLGHRQMAQKFKALGTPYTLNEYKGKHGGHTYRFMNRIHHLQKTMP